MILSADKGWCFATILEALDELGYDVEWQVLNSKHHGVPQNRERVFIIGHIRGQSSRQIFPIGKDAENSIQASGQSNIAGTLTSQYHKMGYDKTYITEDSKPEIGQANRKYDEKGKERINRKISEIEENNIEIKE